VTAEGAKPRSALGFLTTVEDPKDGLFGGYLVLNLAGRPLEFHCTAPIKPNRAQQILYGPTLEPYLFGEQIGQTLVNKGRIEPQAVCTDRGPALALREFVAMPVVLVLRSEDRSPDVDEPTTDEPTTTDRPPVDPRTSPIWRLDAPHGTPSGLIGFRLGRNRVAVPDSGGDDPHAIAERLSGFGFDLAEPFQRIREAIDEARRGGH